MRCRGSWRRCVLQQPDEYEIDERNSGKGGLGVGW